MKYSSVDEHSNGSRRPGDTNTASSRRQRGDDNVSIASSLSRVSKSKKYRHQRINSDLSEPLTAHSSYTSRDEELVFGGGDSGDPFFVFRADLMKKLESVDESLAEYLRVVHETDTAVNTHEFKDSKKQLKRHIKSAESTLRDVQTTVQLVESDRQKFVHIDDSQLYERKSLVNSSQERLARAKEEMNSDSVKLKILNDERNRAMRRAGDNGMLGATTDRERENTSFIIDNQAQTSLLMQHQDETLDELGEVVTRVGEMAGNINEEINQQNKMLNEMEEDMTNVEEELGVVMGKLGKFLKTKDKWQLRTILGLSLTVLILFFLVIYT